MTVKTLHDVELPTNHLQNQTFGIDTAYVTLTRIVLKGIGAHPSLGQVPTLAE